MEDRDFLRLKRLLEECWSWVLITPAVPEESCLIAAHLRVTGFKDFLLSLNLVKNICATH